MTIYRDALGRPDAKASVSVFGADYGKPGTGYFQMTTVSNAPTPRWAYESKDVSHIVAEMEAQGWMCEVGKDGYNAPHITLVHLATQAEIERQKKQSSDKFANAKKGFVRFGGLPKDGQSWNHRDNVPEAGVSVFEAEFVGKEFRVVNVNHVLEASYYSVCDRPAYRIYGEVVGVGADGEPVLKVSKKVKL